MLESSCLSDVRVHCLELAFIMDSCRFSCEELDFVGGIPIKVPVG